MSTTPATDRERDIHSRPLGVVQPAHERAVYALAALAEGRLADAEKHIAAVPDSPLSEQAWKALLCGLLAAERIGLAEASSLLLQAAALAFINGMGEGGPASSGSLRVAARALHHAGKVQRRQDRPDDARQTHLAAYHLRDEHGSWEEVWETAVELGLDCDVARRHDRAQRWHDIAVETAEKTREQPLRKQSIAWTNLSMSFTNSGKHEASVVAAGTARDLWRRHDLGSVEATRSDLRLGTALLRHGEFLHGQDDKRAKPVLEEAVGWLTAAADELPAFGAAQAADVRSCLDQKNFAQRLLASFGS